MENNATQLQQRRMLYLLKPTGPWITWAIRHAQPCNRTSLVFLASCCATSNMARSASRRSWSSATLTTAVHEGFVVGSVDYWSRDEWQVEMMSFQVCQVASCRAAHPLTQACKSTGLSFTKGANQFNFDHVWKNCEAWIFSLFCGMACPVNSAPSIKKKIHQVEFPP